MSDAPQRPADAGAEWITEADIVRAARVIINLRGTTATDHALHRAGDLRLTRSFEAEAIWHRIAKAIERLQAKAPAEGQRVH
jgi:hypothetical protein